LPNSESDTLDSVDNDENVIGGKLGELGKVRERERERERGCQERCVTLTLTRAHTHTHLLILPRLSMHAHAHTHTHAHARARARAPRTHARTRPHAGLRCSKHKHGLHYVPSTVAHTGPRTSHTSPHVSLILSPPPLPLSFSPPAPLSPPVPLPPYPPAPLRQLSAKRRLYAHARHRGWQATPRVVGTRMKISSSTSLPPPSSGGEASRAWKACNHEALDSAHRGWESMVCQRGGGRGGGGGRESFVRKQRP